LHPAELASGWRLACRAQAVDDLTLELAQWEATILTDDTVVARASHDGLGVAVDVGTTTLVAQLIDLRSGQILGVRSAFNAQAQHGADVMSRVDFAVHHGGRPILTRLIRRQIGSLLEELISAAHRAPVEVQPVILVGNTVMHHLFCGLSVEALSRHPFEPDDVSLRILSSTELEWTTFPRAIARFLPGLGGFVGSDLLAGVLATRLHEADKPAALVDLGTNGEIVIGNRERLLVASTAAGPAFEGARIAMGMRAATGAIVSVMARDGALECQVLGDVEPRGICGSGLVDAVAAGLDLGCITSSGRLTRNVLRLAGPVTLGQRDIRELQLAKAAIAAGLRLLAERWGTRVEDLEAIHLAGAFGNYINRSSALRIGLLKAPLERILPVGNTALLGAKVALAHWPEEEGRYPEILARTHHVALNEDPEFQSAFADEMSLA
jgi:uncharacterized 2Fe-2S/4Fe-4S cluster protein (DUF4445 family)